MTYAVVLHAPARLDLQSAYTWAARSQRDVADRWLERFRAALHTLEQNPQRCPLARESSRVEFEVREFLFGRKPFVYRVLYLIDGDTVRILRIRRAQRRFLSGPELDEAAGSDVT